MRGGIFLCLLAWTIAAGAWAQTPPTPQQTIGGYYFATPTTLGDRQQTSAMFDSSRNLLVNCVVGCSGGGGGSNVTIVAPLGSMLSTAAVSVVPASDWLLPAYALTPTFNLGTLNGAATAALQTTGNATLSSILTALGTPFQAGGSIGNTTFAVTQGTSPWVISGTSTVSGTVAATQSGAWNITNVSGTVSLPTGAATSSLQSTINTTLGSPFQAGGSIGNTSFAATQATASALNATVVGTGTFAVQATANVTQFGGSNVVTGTGASGTGIPRVTVSSDSTVGLAAGTAVIGTLNQQGVTSTQTGSAVTTHLTFQSVLASSGTRKACLIQNISTDTMYVYFGTTGSATTSNSLRLFSGQSLNCTTANLVLTDNVAMTSATLDGATYVVVSQ